MIKSKPLRGRLSGFGTRKFEFRTRSFEFRTKKLAFRVSKPAFSTPRGLEQVQVC